MRIALITSRFPPECCGVGDYTLGLARALQEQGHDVVVITRPEQGARPTGIQVVDAPLGGWKDLHGVVRLLERERVELAQIEYSGYGWSRWGFSFWLNALVRAIRQRGIAVNIGLHETYLNFLQHPQLIPISLFQRVHVWLLIAASSQVFVNTPERQRVLRRRLLWCRAKIEYRPNSSTIPVAPLAEEDRRELRVLRSAGPDDCIVATFGLFQKATNLQAVIDAVATAQTARPLRLWLLGDPRGAQPEYLAMLRQRVQGSGIEGRVFWSGYLPPEQVSAHLQAADVFVLPQPDGHLTRSGAFMAAAAHGLPVIAVRNSRNQDEFEGGHNVWLVGLSTAIELEAALCMLAGDRTLRAKLGMNLRRTYQELFDWSVTLRREESRQDCRAAVESAGNPEPARKA
jgi:glycosyltransferase involved in cell wall biosynthesis